MAQRISVEATVLPNPTSIGEVLSFNVEVKTSGEVGYVGVNNPPEADKMVLIQSIPQESRSQMSINGRIEQSVNLTWRFQPTEVGIATIQSVSITVGGVSYRTAPIRVRVLETAPIDPNTNPFAGSPSYIPPPPPPVYRDAAPSKGTPMFIRAVPSATQVYQGQQMYITYYMYIKQGVNVSNNTRISDSWDAEGFWRVELDKGSNAGYETLDGVRYKKVAIKRVVVFPTRTGTLTIDPLQVEGEYQIAILDALDSFGVPDLSFKPFKIRSSPVQVRANPLPTPAPHSFTGSVGRFKLEVWYDKKEVRVGDALQVKVKISGIGNIKALKAPTLELPTVIESNEPIEQIRLDKSGSQLYGSKTFVYTFIPKANGRYDIPAFNFAFFDAGLRSYQNLTYPAQQINVTGSATGFANTTFPLNDVAPLMEKGAWRSANASDLHLRWGFWSILCLFPLLLWGGLWRLRRFQTKLETNVAFARERKAEPAAHKQLKKAKQLLHSGNGKGFYEELSKAVLGFYGNKFNILEKGLTRVELDQALAAQRVTPAVRQKLLQLLQEADAARFSPIQPSVAQMQNALQQAAALIENDA